MNILVTGGAGYIGSHTLVELIKAGHTATVVDNFSNSSPEAIRRVEQITGKNIALHSFDLEDKEQLETLFGASNFDAVIHFAGLKAVGESVEKPLLYYRTNLDSTLSLLETMKRFDVRKIVFSSSATVYGSAPIPYSEESPVGQGITNPYGQTKYMIEQILKDTAQSNASLEISALRYFNPVGAHESGLIGEDPSGVPNNLMPFIAQVASGKRDKLAVFGNDYDTPDGTCLRDYIHVVDLAQGHLSALEHLKPGFNTYNLGSGAGTSVLELINAFTSTTGIDIAYEFAPRRDGDLPAFWANPQKAKAELGWQTTKSIEDMCRDSWNWQSKNPKGYSE
ncbi:MAG TPA: UDP-glucose 4-epimerase GalE [Candidatus Saccharimonadales bacterium]